MHMMNFLARRVNREAHIIHRMKLYALRPCLAPGADGADRKPMDRNRDPGTRRL